MSSLFCYKARSYELERGLRQALQMRDWAEASVILYLLERRVKYLPQETETCKNIRILIQDAVDVLGSLNFFAQRRDPEPDESIFVIRPVDGCYYLRNLEYGLYIGAFGPAIKSSESGQGTRGMYRIKTIAGEEYQASPLCCYPTDIAENLYEAKEILENQKSFVDFRSR